MALKNSEKKWTGYLPIIIPCFFTVVTLYIDQVMPCEGSFFIGGCQMGKAIELIGGILYLQLLVFILYSIHNKQFKFSINHFIIISSFLPIIYLWYSLATDSNLQPYALSKIQQNGRDTIRFVSFSDTPQLNNETHKMTGIVLQSEIQVTKSGIYRVSPMRLKGAYPVKVVESENNRSDRINKWLEANKIYNLAYTGQIISNSAESTGKLDQIVSWDVYWTIDSIPPFPFYLLGYGSYATVYPRNDGEYAYITHFDQRFQTHQYRLSESETYK